MTVRSPQDSVLGTTLWNIVYDEIFRQELRENVTTVCFVDDLAILVRDNITENLITKANEALRGVDRWLIYRENRSGGFKGEKGWNEHKI